MATFTIKRGDTSPALRYALLPDSIDLTGANVVFNMAGVLTRAPASVARLSPPAVQYDWQDGDTDLSGLRRAEFEVTYASGAVETFPADDDLLIHIIDDLG